MSDEWRDVTGECEVNGSGPIIHHSEIDKWLVFSFNATGYRLRKVQFLESIGPLAWQTKRVDALIIEKNDSNS